ncbi:MAG TPA: glycoside hydrolase family 99-like domain-containing protein, partial [Bacteroidia bacterium]|nr:glycoside hydrolase family 99-like domain-containing protein [Bacteroidia bacterium]
HTVTPGWDNSARRSTEFLVLNNSTPELFELWTLHSLQNFRPYSEGENLFFINAWNEWAEGNHLEPDQKWGLAYLDAFRNAIKKFLRTIG